MDSWIKDILPKLSFFLKNMSLDNYSYFKYSFSGDLYTESHNWGLANTVYAVKILYITNLLKELSDNSKLNLINSIKRFEKNGEIYDSLITEYSLKQKIKKIVGILPQSTRNSMIDTRRAETRQSYAALYLLESKPESPYEIITYSANAVTKYLESFGWNLPWHAASHLSHLMFFLWYNVNVFNYKRAESLELLMQCKNWLSGVQSKNDGCWYRGTNVSLNQKINGAMKVITGFHAANIYDFPYPKKLIDTALSGTNNTDACSNFNISYVLYATNKIESEYRKNEIEDFLLNRLEIYKKFYWPELGGFSFHEGRASNVLYGKKITRGKLEPDIHGTIMFIWGISVINQIIDLGLDWKIPLN